MANFIDQTVFSPTPIAPQGAPKVVDADFGEGDPWGQFYNTYQQNKQQNKITTLTKQAKQAQEDALKPQSANLSDYVHGVLPAAGNLITHPLSFATGALGGLADVGPAVVNTANSLGKSILSLVYGADKVGQSNTGFSMPLPGQTLNEFLGSKGIGDKGVLESTNISGKTVGSYELGGALVKSTGLLGPFMGGVAGNVLGGQATLDPNATPAQRAQQAEFDAAFGVATGVLAKGAAALKANKAAQEVVTQAKSGIMDTAITTFEKPGTSAFNPAVAGKLRSFLDSAKFNKPKTMVDFENNLKEALGEDFNKPEVQDALQPIVDAGHKQVSTALGGGKPQVSGKLTSADLFDTETATAKAEAQAKIKPPEIKYVAKDSLGRDELGNKRLAVTNVDPKTGNALVTYDKSLDLHPDAKQAVMDHEMGHILDKRLNKGAGNISAELPNYTGNKGNLDSVLDDFAKSNGISSQEAAAGLHNDIQTLSGGKGDTAENFADAYAKFKQDPKAAMEYAPTFTKLMQFTPDEGSLTSHSTSLASLKQDSPIAGKLVEDKLTEAKAEIKAKADAKVKSSKIAGTGLETGKTVKDKLSFNPDTIESTADVDKLFNKMEGENKSFSDARMSKGDEDIRDLARLTGLTEKELIAAKPGSIANAETLTAARQLVLNKAGKLAEKIKSIDTATATTAQLQEVRDDFVKMVSMQKSVAGLRSEAANTLRSLGLKLSPDENFTMKELLSKLKELNVASGDDASLFAGKVAKEFQLTRAQHVGQGALQTWYASILSGPKTTARNIVSTGSNILTELAAKTANPKQWKEVVPAVQGLLSGLKDGAVDFKAIMKGDEASVGKFVDESSVRPATFTGKFATYGKVVESVGRFLNAQDALLKSGARAMEESSLKVSSPKMSQEVQKAVASWYGDFVVYHGEPRGQVVGAISKGTRMATNMAPVLKVIVPFVKTVSNVLDRNFDYMPITAQLRMRPAFIAREVDQMMKHFDLSSEADRAAITQRLYDQQTGRMLLGTAVTTAATVAAMNGLVSGSGPTNYNERIQLQRTGWRPNSVKIGDVWVPYSYLGPLGGILSVAGNIYDKVTYDNAPNGDISKLIVKGLVGWGQSQLQQSFLSGVSDFMNVLSGGTSPSDYATKLAGGLVPIPAAFTQTKDMVENIYSHLTGDPTLRQQYETQGIVDSLRAKLGLTGSVFGSDSLKPRLDMFGQPMTSDFIFGMSPSLTKNDAVDNYLIANDIVITIPPKGQQYTNPGDGSKVALTADQYEEYVKTSGQQIYENLQDMIPSLQDEDIDSQRSEIRAMLDQVRSQTRDDILNK